MLAVFEAGHDVFAAIESAPPLDPSRALVVPAEDRTLRVAAETRLRAVAREGRVVGVVAEDRTIFVSA